MSKVLRELTDREEIVAECLDDPVFFCEFFFPHLFPTPLKWFHRGILAILTKQTAFLMKYGEVDKIIKNFISVSGPLFVVVDGELRLNVNNRVLVMMPRGSAKTTLVGIAYPLYAVCMQLMSFGVYISEAGPHAEMQLNNVKRELETNEKLRYVFGDLAPSHNSSLKWTAHLAETTTGPVLVARGRGAQIRGLNSLGRRPNLLLLDDVEDKESVSTEDQRKKVRVWAYGDLLPALDDLDPDAMVLVLCTLLHPDALAGRWAKSKAWTAVVLGAEDVDGEPIWEEKYNKEKMLRLKTEFVEHGLLYEFYLEYYNQATVPELQVFKPQYLQYCEAPTDLLIAIAIDPALSKDKRASEAVITVAGMSAQGKIWVLDEWAQRGNDVRELIDRYFELAIKWQAQRHGIESISFQAVLIHLVKEEMFRKHWFFEPLPITHTKSKPARIKGILQPRYASGHIYHARHFSQMEMQLLDFKPERELANDRIDNLANVVSLLDPWAGSAGGTMADKENVLTAEQEVGGEWRII